MVLEHFLYCNCLKCYTLGWSNLGMKGEGKEELPWDPSPSSHHTTTKPRALAPQAGLRRPKGRLLVMPLHTQVEMSTDRGGDGSVMTGMCTNTRSLRAPGCAAVCPGLPSHKPPCPLQGPITTLRQNPPWLSAGAGWPAEPFRSHHIYSTERKRQQPHRSILYSRMYLNT